MIDCDVVPPAGYHVGAGNDRGDVTARRHRTAASGVGGALVPGEDQEPVRPKLAEQQRDRPRQERITGGDAAVVHVIADVGRDPHEGRQ